jgi:hypothetical protein
MRARIYDPKLGRFLQPDPIGYDDGMNMYAYTGGDPVNRSDPSGLAVSVGSLTCEGGIEANGDGGWQCDGGGAQSATFVPAMPIRFASGFDAPDGGGGQLACEREAQAEGRRGFCFGPNRSSGPLRSSPRPMSQRNAVARALRLINPRADIRIVQPHSANFARVTDRRRILDGAWRRSIFTSHAKEAWERRIPGQSFVLKLYVADRSAGGVDTIAVVYPTLHPMHTLDNPSYRLGSPVNYWYARSFCENVGGCDELESER